MVSIQAGRKRTHEPDRFLPAIFILLMGTMGPNLPENDEGSLNTLRSMGSVCAQRRRHRRRDPPRT